MKKNNLVDGLYLLNKKNRTPRNKYESCSPRNELLFSGDRRKIKIGNVITSETNSSPPDLAKKKKVAVIIAALAMVKAKNPPVLKRTYVMMSVPHEPLAQ